MSLEVEVPAPRTALRRTANEALTSALVILTVLGAASRAGAWDTVSGRGRLSTADKELIKAAIEGDADRARELLARGANANAVKLGCRKAPLHLAAERGHAEVVRILLAARADVNREAGEGQTPLFLAVRVDRNLGVQRALLGEAWSSLPVNTEYVLGIGRPGGTPLSLPVRDEFKETISALVAAGAKDALYGAVALGDAEQAKTLLASGADVNATHGCMDAVLHVAAERGHKDIVATLIAVGADVNAKTAHAQTPIELGLVMGHQGIVAILIAAGAEMPEELEPLKKSPGGLAETDEARELLDAARKELEAARKARRAGQ